MDGVLIDSEPVNLQLIKSFYEEHGHIASTDFLNSLVGRSQHDTWDICKKQWEEDISFERYNEMYQAYRNAHSIDYKSILFPQVIELLTWLKEKGFKIAVASSSRMHTIDKVLKACEIESFFDLKMSGEMFEKSKPDPEIYIKTAENLGFDVSDCIAVEDSKAGIASCLAANMKVIAKIDLRYGANPDLATMKVHDLSEIKSILN